MTLLRIRLTHPPATFIPTDRLARISLAWWDPSEPEGRREPVLVQGPHGPRTVVVVWPVDSRGRLDVEAVQRGDVQVLPWDVSPVLLEELQRLAREWELDRVDLFVTETTLGPAPLCLRVELSGFLGSVDRVVEEVSRGQARQR